MVALASAFVRLRPEVNKGDYQKSGAEAGQVFGDAAGKASGKGIPTGVDKGLEEAKKRAAASGGDAGKKWGDGFYRDSQGKIRDAQGKFVQSSIASGETAGKGFGKGFGKGSSGIVGSIKQNLSLAAGVFVPLGLAAAVGEIGKIGIAYEDNLNIFKTVSKATGDQMKAVADQARLLGSDIELPGVSAAGAAAAMTELAKAGFSVDEAMAAAKGTLQLARVANIDEADAAEIAANAVNAFGIEAKDTTFVVDELAAAANSSSIEITEAKDSFKQAAAVFSGLQGRVVGPKEAITELNTAVAILGNNGIKGSDAGTSLKQMLLQLTGPSQQAKDQMALLAQRAGGATISLKEQNDVLRGSKGVREKALAAIKEHNKGLDVEGDIAYDSAGKMRPLRDIIDLVARGTKGLSQEESDYAVTQIFGADASRAVLALLKGGLPVYDAQRKAVTQQGAAAEVAAAKNAGLGGAIDNVKGQIENAAIDIYNVIKGPLTNGLNALAGALPKVFDGVRNVFGFLAAHKDVVIGVAIAIGVLTAAVKIQAAANAVAAGGGIIKFLLTFAKSTAVATAAQALFNLVLEANPIGLTVIAIAALVAAIVIAYKKSETFRNIVNAVWGAIKVAIAATVSWLQNTALPIVLKVWDAIKVAALFLWHNVIQPAWSGIMAAVRVAVQGIQIYIGFAKAAFNVIATVVKFLYNNIFSPVFKAISKVVEIWWLAIRVVFTALKLFLVNVMFPTIRFFYSNVIAPIFKAIGTVISAWWRYVVTPAFNGVKAGFSALGTAFKYVWEKIIRPVFEALGKFIKGNVVPAFEAGVGAIKKAWEKVQEIARKPVAFVVNQVINPFIGGLNKVAGLVGIKDKVEPIKGFAAGGQIPGTPVKGRDNRLASITGTGTPLAVASGEFITNTRSTLANLGLVKAINAKQGKVSHADVDPYLDGGGDGIGDIWNSIKKGASGLGSFVTNPGAALKKAAELAIAKVPGAGMLKDFVVGGARKLVSGIGAFIKSKLSLGGGDAGSIGGGGVFGGWKGMQRLISARFPGLNLISGFRQGARTLSGNQSYHALGRAVDYPPVRALAQWIRSTFGAKTKELITPYQELNLHNGKPHTYTGAIWNQHNFAGGNAHVHWAAKNGGLVGDGSGMPIKLFDQGGAWPSGTIGANLSGRTEYVDPNRGGHGMGDVVDRLEAVIDAIVEVAPALGRELRASSRGAVQASRARGRTAIV